VLRELWILPVIPSVLMTIDLIDNDGRNILHRGSETCGDIDVMITRSDEDGKTHVGGYHFR
jgi:hypothetical protein